MQKKLRNRDFSLGYGNNGGGRDFSGGMDGLPVIGPHGGMESNAAPIALPEQPEHASAPATMQAEGGSPWAKVLNVATGAASGLTQDDTENTSSPYMPVITAPLQWNPYYANPYQRAKFGGKFYPGDKVVVGDGSGPETLEVQQDGVKVIPNAADVPNGDEETKRVMAEANRIAALPKMEIPDTTPADSGRSLPTIDSPQAKTAVSSAPTLPAIPYSVSDDLAAKQKELADVSQYKDRKWSKWDKLAAAADGWARGGIFGAIGAVKNPHYFEDQRIARDRARLLPQIETLSQMEAQQVKQEQAKAQTDWTRQRPTIEQKKLEEKAKHGQMTNMQRQYNSLPDFHDDDQHPDDKQFADAWEQLYGYRPPSKDAKTKSEQIIDQKTGQVYLLQTDAQGGQSVIKLTNDDGTPFTIESKEMLTSEDRAKQRELQKLIAENRNVTSVNVANINAGSHREVATINQSGGLARGTQSQASNAAKVLAAIEASAPTGATPEQIKAKKDAYLNSLPADVRAAIPQ